MSLIPTSVSLTIPVFNNERTLKTQIDRCQQVLERLCQTFEIIICDDKSSDKSPKILKSFYQHNPRFKLIFHHKNLGIAPTIYQLYQEANNEYISLFSADGDWNPDDISRLIRLAYRKKADIVIGTRNKSDYTLYRKIVSFFYNILPEILFKVKTFDAASIKVFRTDLFHQIPLISRSVFFEAELIIRATKLGFMVISCPVKYKKIIKKTGSGGKPAYVLAALIDLFRLRILG